MTIDELNETVASGGIDEFIRVCEARQVKALSKVADSICAEGGRRLVLLAGASSAGKTTTAKRLCTQIRVNGFEAVHMSTDDYFVGDSRNPRDENGDFDYETIECVDVQRLASDINRLLAGETIHPRRFNFVVHEGFDSEEPMKVSPGGYLVLEGIHALNPLLSDGIDEGSKCRLFIEPKTQPEVFGRTRLPMTDARLLRRIVRDNQFRHFGPDATLKMWPKVLAGEEKWINPFRSRADYEFDSSLAYELAVLKPFVLGLLYRYSRCVPGNVKVEQLMALLSVVRETDPTKVPGDSILRETIGGSQLEY